MAGPGLNGPWQSNCTRARHGPPRRPNCSIPPAPGTASAVWEGRDWERLGARDERDARTVRTGRLRTSCGGRGLDRISSSRTPGPPSPQTHARPNPSSPAAHKAPPLFFWPPATSPSPVHSPDCDIADCLSLSSKVSCVPTRAGVGGVPELGPKVGRALGPRCPASLTACSGQSGPGRVDGRGLRAGELG